MQGVFSLVIVIKNRFQLLAVFLVLAALVSLLQFVGGQAVKTVSGLLLARQVPIYRVDVPEKKVAISFDAMWGTERTDRLLAVLRRHNVKTTFFLAGYWLEKNPDYVRKIAAEGHEMGNHSYTHPHMANLSPNQIREELEKTHALIKQLTNQDSFLFRPPFGEYNDRVIEGAAELGYYTIQWSVDSLDWKNVSKDDIVRRILQGIKPGDIILFHNDGLHTAAAVDEILTQLLHRGYQVVPVSQLIYKDGYFIEKHSGTQRRSKSQRLREEQ